MRPGPPSALRHAQALHQGGVHRALGRPPVECGSKVWQQSVLRSLAGHWYDEYVRYRPKVLPVVCQEAQEEDYADLDGQGNQVSAFQQWSWESWRIENSQGGPLVEPARTAADLCQHCARLAQDGEENRQEGGQVRQESGQVGQKGRSLLRQALQMKITNKDNQINQELVLIF